MLDDQIEQMHSKSCTSSNDTISKSSNQEFSYETLQLYSDQIKDIWKTSPKDLLNDENIKKIYYFPRFFNDKCHLDQLSLAHYQIINVAWKNFIYPIIKLFKVKTTENGPNLTLPKNSLKNFLQCISEILIDSLRLIKQKDPSEIQKLLIYKVSLIIGDVQKYLIVEDPSISPQDAEKFFIYAIFENMTDGIPFNQAGILYQYSKPIYSMIYFYLATLGAEPFKLADTNASNILDCMRERFFGHIKKKCIIEDIRELLPVSFINVIDVFLNRTDDVKISRIDRLIVNYKFYYRDFMKSEKVSFQELLLTSTEYDLLLMICIQKSLIFPNICRLFETFLLLNISELLRHFKHQIKTHYFVPCGSNQENLNQQNSSEYTHNNIHHENIDDEGDDIIEYMCLDNQDNNNGPNSLNNADHKHSFLDKINQNFDALKQWTYMILIFLYGKNHLKSRKMSFLQKIFNILIVNEKFSSLFESNANSSNDSSINSESVAKLEACLNQTVLEHAVFYITKQTVNESFLVSLIQKIAAQNQYYLGKIEGTLREIHENGNNVNVIETVQYPQPSSTISYSDNQVAKLKPIQLQFSLNNSASSELITHLPRHLIPLSNTLINNLDLIMNLEHKHQNSIHILTSVLDVLDSSKTDNKFVRDAISFINEAFNQENTCLIPENVGYRENIPKFRHRNRTYLEITDAFNYADFLISKSDKSFFDKNSLPFNSEDIAIIISDDIIKEQIFFDIINMIKSKGFSIIDPNIVKR